MKQLWVSLRRSSTTRINWAVLRRRFVLLAVPPTPPTTPAEPPVPEVPQPAPSTVPPPDRSPDPESAPTPSAAANYRSI